MRRSNRTLTILSVVGIALAAAAMIQAVEPGERTPFGVPANAGDVIVAETDESRAVVTLSWDDGTFENGLGPTGGHYDGQFAMRFGGSAATSDLVPFQIQGASVRIRSGNAGITLANVNFWHPLTNSGFPANPAPLVQAPAVPVTGVTQVINLAGPTISTADGSVMVGLGGLGTTSWFIDRDSDGPDNDREFAGSSSSNTLALSYSPTMLGNLGLSGNYFVRLIVDGNIPVELERLTVE